MSQSPKARKLLIPVILTVFIDLLGTTIVIPILAPLFLELQSGIIPVDVSALSAEGIKALLQERTIILGILLGVFPLAQFFGAPILGAWADKVGRKKVLLLSLVGTLIGYIMFAFGVRYQLVWLLFASRALDGFTGGNISIVFSAISDISTPETKTKNFGLVGMAFGFGFIIGPYIGGMLSDPTVVSWFNFETPFWFSAIICLVNIFLVIIYFFETLKTSRDSKFNLWQGFKNIGIAFQSLNLRTIFMVSFFLTFGFTLFTQFLQVFLIDKFEYRVSDIGKFFAFVGIFIAITQGLLTPIIGKWLGPKKVVGMSTLGIAIVLILYVFPSQSIYLYFLAPFLALNQGLMAPNLQTLVSNSAADDQQGEILGINQSVQALGRAIPPILAGFVASLNVNLPIIFGSFFTFIAWLIFMYYYKPFKRTEDVKD